MSGDITTNLTMQIDIKNDQIVPKITSGSIKDKRDKTTLLIALDHIRQSILHNSDLEDLNERLKNA